MTNSFILIIMLGALSAKGAYLRGIYIFGVLQDLCGHKKFRKKVLVSLLRTCAFLGTFLLAIIFIGLTWIRPQFPIKSCRRPCNVLDLPMICRLQFTVEAINYHKRDCISCHSNPTKLCRECGEETISINRQFSPPQIEVCENDIVVVDVLNNVPNTSINILWNGQDEDLSTREEDRIFYNSLTNKCDHRYKFRTTHPGFHVYSVLARGKSQVDLNSFHETTGSLIVRKLNKIPRGIDNEKLIEIFEHDQELKIKTSPESQSSVNDSTLFQVLYSNSTSRVPINLSVRDHKILVHSINGNSIKSTNFPRIKLRVKDYIEFSLMPYLYSKNTRIFLNVSTEGFPRKLSNEIDFHLENSSTTSFYLR
ncbi:uncharacterized protein LOC129786489 [Lutzomyia longipalpis]|uniref:uncharacterized protein LOC129786489 n=1 Tax=Lutzomyia longipalpis TaxID=7200 RepID=UPI002484268F|nr:uncharacterized protein LOC129786489 [Lutzomyia longipalpis]